MHLFKKKNKKDFCPVDACAGVYPKIGYKHLGVAYSLTQSDSRFYCPPWLCESEKYLG